MSKTMFWILLGVMILALCLAALIEPGTPPSSAGQPTPVDPGIAGMGK